MDRTSRSFEDALHDAVKQANEKRERRQKAEASWLRWKPVIYAAAEAEAAFISLKIVGLVHISWAYVTAPIWLPLVFALNLVAFALIGAVVKSL